MFALDETLAERIDAEASTRAQDAATWFETLRNATADGPGVTRASYQQGEQTAHDLMTQHARNIGLQVSTDAIGNLIMRWPGSDATLPAWVSGSHLDSVHQGGNFDGAAGVIAALLACAAMRRAGFSPRCDIVIIGFRAEECSTWFVGKHGGHLGSRAALGLLAPEELDSAVHITTGKTFAQMIDAAGFNSKRVRDTTPILPAATLAGYIELHIEQGPVLEHAQHPVGIVSSIRGCYRARNAVAVGEYSHSGGVPHELRRDAVMAVADLVMTMDAEWTRRRQAGEDLVLTFGKFCTDASLHSIVKVPGRVDFAVDIRSQDNSVLLEMEARMREAAAQIGISRRVHIDLGHIDRVTPAGMDPRLQAQLTQIADRLNVPALKIASGGGHDAADFHDVGVPTAMIFVRNDNGSHNPEESMEIEDFIQGVRILARFLAEQTG